MIAKTGAVWYTDRVKNKDDKSKCSEITPIKAGSVR